MPLGPHVTKERSSWAAPGDVNAFFGLMLDNIADLLLTVSLLSAVFGFPTEFALTHMVPGTAIGVLIGDLYFFWMALKLAQRTGGKSITSMPLGLDTPSTFGMVFFVLGPTFAAAKAAGLSVEESAIRTWHVGICAIFVSGLFKLICAFGSAWIRRVVPRAGLLGSLTSISLVIICFMPLVEFFHEPVVGLTALAIILTTLVARVPVPFKVPGAVAALLVGGLIYYGMKLQTVGSVAELFSDPHQPFEPAAGLLPTAWLEAFGFGWTKMLFTAEFANKLPIILPFALATVVGGIDCTESAAAAGDEYDTGQVIGVEAIATLIAALCGGVIQTTPYIGHPAYKAMGGRAAYTLATALFVGSAGVLGYFGYLYLIIPKAAVYPILVFVGLEITAQSFHATPNRHYPAVAFACIPALAYLVIIHLDPFLPRLGELSADDSGKVLTIRMLSANFIITSLVWGAALAAIIDRQLYRAAAFFAAAAVCTLFGVMHSPFAGGPVFLPWQITQETELQAVLHFAAGYMTVTVLMLAWGAYLQFVDPALRGEGLADPH